MAINLSDFFSVLMSGEAAATGQLLISPEKTAAIQEILNDLDHHEQVATCLMALLSRYRNGDLIHFCIQKLLDVRPTSMGPHYRAWSKEVYHLSLSLRGSAWEEDFRQKIKLTYPKVAMNLWPQPIQSQPTP